MCGDVAHAYVCVRVCVGSSMCMCVLVTNFTMRMCVGLLCVVCMCVLVSVQLPEVHSVCMCVGACVCVSVRLPEVHNARVC